MEPWALSGTKPTLTGLGPQRTACCGDVVHSQRRICRSLIPTTSAASHYLDFLVEARKITSRMFIVLSLPAAR